MQIVCRHIAQMAYQRPDAPQLPHPWRNFCNTTWDDLEAALWQRITWLFSSYMLRPRRWTFCR